MKRPRIVYEMLDDNTPTFRRTVQRMIALGYNVSVKPVEREYHQSQLIGNQTIKL